jgi:hypothetical protein
MTTLEIGEGIRQGDVFLFRVADGELPEAINDKPVKGLHVLAYGESTGHCHAIKVDDSELYLANDNTRKLATKYGVMDIRAVTHGLRIVVDNTKLLHGTPSRGFTDPDHTPINLPKGDYIVLRPCEYSDSEEFRVIAD